MVQYDRKETMQMVDIETNERSGHGLLQSQPAQRIEQA